MSVVIVGGNARMVCQYENICKGYGCKAKVFAKEKGTMKKKIGAPDLLILFHSTFLDRKSTRLNSSHSQQSRMPSSA